MKESELKTQREAFVKKSFEQKRETVAMLLEWVREMNPLFEDLYNLVISDYAIEQDFYDVFDSLMIVLYREGKATETEALNHLDEVRNRLQAQKAMEDEEKNAALQDVESLLLEMV